MMKSMLALLLAVALMPAPAVLAADDDFDDDTDGIERNVEDRDPRRLSTEDQDVGGTYTIRATERATDDDCDHGSERNVEDRDPRRLKTRERCSTDDVSMTGYVR